MTPALTDHFVRGSAWGLLRRGHPYDFVETYDVLTNAYGYTSRYVNLGHWDASLVADSEGDDPGTRLLRALRALVDTPLAGDARVLDIGAGLGQGAIDLARWTRARVTGVNINARQIEFARALAASHGFGDRVTHVQHDVTRAPLAAIAGVPFHAAFAVECVGHFKDLAAFLTSLRAALAPGAALVMCMNVATAPLPFSFRAMLRATYGFVPRTLDVYRDALTAAGFTDVRDGDLTAPVLARGTRAVLARIADPAVRARVPLLTRFLVEQQLSIARDAVARGALGYAWVTARV